MKQIILCADDFGQSAAISSGILQLVQMGRLSAVSCMTEADAWQEWSGRLARQSAAIDIGLHFNLTHACALQTSAPETSAPESWSARPLNSILIDSLCGRLDRRALATTLHAQLDRFETAIGKAPDFIDGHQHVHMLPGVRSVLLAEIGRRYAGRKPYLRNVNPPLLHSPAPLKTILLKTLNAGFAVAAHRTGIACTRGFGGIYSLRPDADFPALMQDWLAHARSGDLLMCHPGVTAVDATDPITATRPRELQHLSSDDFAAQMHAANVRLSRFVRAA